MQAIVIAAGFNPALEPLTEWYPPPLLPVVDRPLAQHVVEYLVDQGVTEFDFVLSHLPEKLEAFLGDGARWGCRFRYHLVRDSERPYQILSAIALPGEATLLAHADRLPLVTLKGRNGVLFSTADENPARRPWTGWALLQRDVILNIPEDVDEAALSAYLFSVAPAITVEQTPIMLNVRSFDMLIQANRQALSGAFPVRLLSGTQTDPGIWISRNVSLHPTAILTSPVFIGENCRIGAGTHIGPGAVIERDCILDNQCTVRDTLIFQNSYIGESLELQDAIVDRNRLINTRVGVAVSITDNFILGSLSERHMKQWTGRKMSQTIGIILLLTLWPLMLLTALFIRLARRGPALFKTEAVRLPADGREWEWKTFSWRRFSPEAPAVFLSKCRYFRGLRHWLVYVLPALINIAKGELRFVGVPPREKSTISSLSHDWQTLYLGSKAGAITETDIQYFGVIPTDDDAYSSEAFYAVSAGPVYDLKLLWKYLLRVLNPLG